MIPSGSAGVKKSRSDVGLSQAGNLRCEELSDRAGTTIRTTSGKSVGPVQMRVLRGTVTSFMCRQEGPTEGYGNVQAPPTVSPGTCHASFSSLDTSNRNKQQAIIGPTNYTNTYSTTGYHSTGEYDHLSGLSYFGVIDESGTYDVWVDALLGGQGSTTYRNIAVEVIGWSTGFFRGTTKYYLSQQYTGDISGKLCSFSADLGAKYLTINVQGLTRGGAPTSLYTDVRIKDLFCRKSGTGRDVE